MEYVVSFSGGIGSFVATHRLLTQIGKDDRVTLLFCDTLIEDEDLYRFLDESAAKLGLPVVKIADGRTPWEVFKDVRYQGNTRTAHCSQILKTELARNWIYKNFPDLWHEYTTEEMISLINAAESHEEIEKLEADGGYWIPENVTLVLGIDWQESERLERAQKNWDIPVIAPLCDKPYLTKGRMREIVESYDIKIPRLYDLGFPHNNCGGFCVRAGLKQFKALMENFPERFEFHRQEQEKLMQEVPTVRPFLRKNINGELNYITLTDFKNMNAPEPDAGELQWGGCGCFIDTQEKVK